MSFLPLGRFSSSFLQHDRTQRVHKRGTQQRSHRHRHHPRVHNVPEQAPVDGLLLPSRVVMMLVRTAQLQCLLLVRRQLLRGAGLAHKHHRTDLAVRRRDGQTDLGREQHRERRTDFDGEATKKTDF